MSRLPLQPDPCDPLPCDDDIADVMSEYAEESRFVEEELADYNDSMARCHEDGWFYDDNDPDPW